MLQMCSIIANDDIPTTEMSHLLWAVRYVLKSARPAHNHVLIASGAVPRIVGFTDAKAPVVLKDPALSLLLVACSSEDGEMYEAMTQVCARN